MSSKPYFPRSAALVAAGAVALVAVSGCIDILAKKQNVIVDAISAADVPKPSGQSYRLFVRHAVPGSIPVQLPVVAACVDAALVGQGMFEAPPRVPPDVFIEVGFGTDSTPRIDLASRETFLQLVARENPGRSLDGPTGREVWDVRVSVFGMRGRIESAMPMLSAVAASNIATNSHQETETKIRENSPLVVSVREAAVEALETGGRAGGGAAARPTGSLGGGSTGPAK